MGNSSTAIVMGKGKILLKFTSSKLPSSSNVLYVSALHRNLVSGIFLNKARLQNVVEDDKVVISHNGVFVGKRYLNGSLFVLNLACETINRNSSSFAHIYESVDLWNGRLGHVNFASIKQLKNMQLIPTVNIDNFTKCSMFAEEKHAKKPLKSVTGRQTALLELVYLDLADFRNTSSKEGKRYYITFVDDCSSHTKVYLVRSKNEDEKIFLKYKAEVES